MGDRAGSIMTESSGNRLPLIQASSGTHWYPVFTPRPFSAVGRSRVHSVHSAESVTTLTISALSTLWNNHFAGRVLVRQLCQIHDVWYQAQAPDLQNDHSHCSIFALGGTRAPVADHNALTGMCVQHASCHTRQRTVLPPPSHLSTKRGIQPHTQRLSPPLVVDDMSPRTTIFKYILISCI